MKNSQKDDPYGWWSVKYYLRRSHKIVIWRGQARNENLAKMFSHRALLREGYSAANLQFTQATREE